MNRIRACFGDQGGMALVMALVMLMVLTGLTLAFLSVSAFEPQISQNLASTAQARMVADAGLEWAFNRLATLPAGRSYDEYWDGLLSAGGQLNGGAMPIPGLTASAGTFSATVRNDATAADRAITGVAPDPVVVPPRDANGRVIVTSIGTVGGVGGLGAVSTTVLAVVRRIMLPPINAALALPGRQATLSLGGSSLDIEGIDHDLSGSPVTQPGVAGITVSGEATDADNEARVVSALLSSPETRVLGTSDSTGLPVTGADAVRADPSLTAQQVADFAAAIRSHAEVTLTTAAGTTLGAADLGATCDASWASSSCWGTPEQPKIVHVKGDPTAPSPINVSGQSAGTGILVVENAWIEVTGSFRWNGPIIVSGPGAGIHFKGSASQEIYGAVIVNATDPTGPDTLTGDAASHARIFYSVQALALVQHRLGRRLMTLYSWREQ